jgi:hypothetical protein
VPVLYLDNVPDELFHRIEQLAKVDQLPVAEETLHLLKQAVALKQSSTEAAGRANVRVLLEEMRRNRIVPAPGTPASVELLREDRNR